MAATIITSNMLNALRQHIVDQTAYARYKINGTWYKAEINSKEVRENGAVHITFYVQRAGGTNAPATQFQICTSSGAVLAERTENVAFVANMDAILYRFKFGVSVGETPVT